MQSTNETRSSEQDPKDSVDMLAKDFWQALDGLAPHEVAALGKEVSDDSE